MVKTVTVVTMFFFVDGIILTYFRTLYTVYAGTPLECLVCAGGNPIVELKKRLMQVEYVVKFNEVFVLFHYSNNVVEITYMQTRKDRKASSGMSEKPPILTLRFRSVEFNI